MAQADQVVQNTTFPATRTDINDNLAALYSQSSGNSEPTTKVAFQPWIDTSVSPPLWKIRNNANTAWITVGTLDATFSVGGLTAIANGGTGAVTAAAALAALLPSQTGNSGKALTTDGTTATWGTIATLQSGIAVASTSGTSIDFTGIPSSAKRIKVMLKGVSLSGTALIRFRLGTSGGVVTTGYLGAGSIIGAGTGTANQNAGFDVYHNSPSAASIYHGAIDFALVEASSNSWAAHGVFSLSSAAITFTTAGSLALSSALTSVRVTTSGADTFDAGTINILYE